MLVHKPGKATGRWTLVIFCWRFLQGSDSAAVVPVRVDSHNGVVLETSFQEGIRREALRSLAQVANASELPLQVRCSLAWSEATDHAGALAALAALPDLQTGLR